MATLSLDQPTNNALQFAFINDIKNFRASTLKSKSCTQVLYKEEEQHWNKKLRFIQSLAEIKKKSNKKDIKHYWDEEKVQHMHSTTFDPVCVCVFFLIND